MISQFVVCIQGGLGSLFPCPYLLGSLTPFGKEQQREGEHILYSFSHPHPQTRLSLPPLYRHANLAISVLKLLVPSCHSHYPRIAGA